MRNVVKTEPVRL